MKISPLNMHPRDQPSSDGDDRKVCDVRAGGMPYEPCRFRPLAGLAASGVLTQSRDYQSRQRSRRSCRGGVSGGINDGGDKDR
jgi:hypothetical protein